MYVRTDKPAGGITAATVYAVENEKTRSGALVAYFRHRDPAQATLWANRFAAGMLDVPEPSPQPVPVVAVPVPVDEAPPVEGPPASVAAKKLAEANGVDLDKVNYNGDKITKPDVEQYIIAHTGDMPKDPPADEDAPSGG